ncbi:psychosine receptor [Tiliqua scincoides]|uniref:psychosine receptor n=1 Tax=Tiliqua scincoides TaxID=71010 RepID=UPI003461ED8D
MVLAWFKTMTVNQCEQMNCSIDHTLDKNLFPPFFSILFIISIPANCASLFISICQVKKKNELGVYLLNLSIADLLYTLTLPMWIHYALKSDNWVLPKNVCIFSTFLTFLNYYTSSGFLACISIDRYLAVVHPLKFHYFRTRRCASTVSILVWAFEIISNVQILRHTDFFPHAHNDSNHSICYDVYPLQQWQAELNLYRICVGYAVPLAIIVFCYQKIYRAVKHNQATEDRDKKKINHLLLSIIVTFFVCFTPYHVVLLIRSISEPCNCPFALKMFKPYRIATVVTSLNCIADPILYCFVSETGRADIWNIVKCGSSATQTDAQNSQNIAVSKMSQDTSTKNRESTTLL